MFTWAVYRWHLALLQRQSRASRRRYHQLLKMSKSSDDRKRLESDAIREEEEFRDEIGALQHRYLVEKAQRHLIPLPDFDGSKDGVWEESRIDGKWRLTRTALTKLRSAIRAEQKETLESWSRGMAIVIPVLSLVTTIIALLKK